MTAFKIDKVVGALPGALTPNTVYAVRTGAGFDLYITDSTGATAHKINKQLMTPDEVEAALTNKSVTLSKMTANDGISGGTRTAISGMTLLSNVVHNLHPEDTGTSILPFFTNDLAFLMQRGGNCVITSGHTPNPGVSGDMNSLFDCSALAFAFNVNTLVTPPPPVVFEVTLHRLFRYTVSIGFSSGFSFRAKNFSIEVRDAVTGVWTTIANKTESSEGMFVRTVSVGANGIDRIRYSFSNFAATSTFRISQFFMTEYKSNLGREVFVTRDKSSILGKLAVGVEDENPLTTLAVNGDAGPYTDNGGNCGIASRKWSNVYAVSGTINTSDARLKTPVRPFNPAEIAAACELSREIGVFQWLSAIEKKGADQARYHIGATVQRVIEIMTAHGLDPFRYGIVCFDSWPDKTIDLPAETVDNEDGTQTEVAPARVELLEPAGDVYSLRYDQLMAFALRGLTERVSRLEG